MCVVKRCSWILQATGGWIVLATENIYEGRSKTPSSSFSLWPRLLKETLGQVCKKARVAQERARASARRKVIPQLLVLNEFKMQAI